MEKQEYKFIFDLTKDEIEEYYGIQIPLEEWIPFCNAFHDFFKLEYRATLDWLIEDGWEEWKDEYIKNK